MAIELPIMHIPGATTTTDLSGTTGTTNGYKSTGQYLFAKPTTTNDLYGVAAIGDIPVGVIQNNPKYASGYANVGVSIMCLGVTKIMVGQAGNLTASQIVGPDANGCAVARVLTSGGADAGRYVGGIIVEGGNSGELASMLIIPPWVIQA